MCFTLAIVVLGKHILRKGTHVRHLQLTKGILYSPWGKKDATSFLVERAFQLYFLEERVKLSIPTRKLCNQYHRGKEDIIYPYEIRVRGYRTSFWEGRMLFNSWSRRIPPIVVENGGYHLSFLEKEGYHLPSWGTWGREDTIYPLGKLEEGRMPFTLSGNLG